MGYDLKAVITSTKAMEVLVGQYKHAFPSTLMPDLLLLPHVMPFIPGEDEIKIVHDEQFWFLDIELYSIIMNASEVSPVAYVESDYFGGTGGQAAVVWRNGEIEFGPEEHSYKKVAKHKLPPPKENGPISLALRQLGVQAEGSKDEFATVGLNRHRHTLLWTPQEWRDQYADGYR